MLLSRTLVVLGVLPLVGACSGDDKTRKSHGSRDASADGSSGFGGSGASGAGGSGATGAAGSGGTGGPRDAGLDAAGGGGNVAGVGGNFGGFGGEIAGAGGITDAAGGATDASDAGDASDASDASDAGTDAGVGPALCAVDGGCAWTKNTPAGSPPPLAWPAMAYDPARDRTILFGGAPSIFGGGLTNRTWAWDGSTWTELFPSSSPSARWTHGMVYDDARQRIVLFGGLSGSGSGSELSDTWEWDGANWTQITTSTSPPPRGVHGALAYDSTRRRVVLRGGGVVPGVSPLGDTWEYDGTAWTEVTGTGPSARVAPGMAFDRTRGRVVLFGGGNWNPYFSDTWQYDGTTWTQHFPTTSPSSRQSARMVYDRARSVAVLFGGDDGAALNDLWEWDGSNWAQVSVSGPPPRCCYAFAHDTSRGVALLYGGGDLSTTYGETWSFGQ